MCRNVCPRESNGFESEGAKPLTGRRGDMDILSDKVAIVTGAAWGNCRNSHGKNELSAAPDMPRSHPLDDETIHETIP